PRDPRAVERRDAAHHAVAGDEDRSAVLLPAVLAGRGALRLGPVRLALPGPARADGVPLGAELLSHRGLTWPRAARRVPGTGQRRERRSIRAPRGADRRRPA